MSDDELDRLARQDVALRFAPPAPGSDRYQSLLERAMTTTATAPRPVEARPSRRRRRWIGWTTAAVAAAASVIAVGAAVVRGPAEPAHAEPPATTMRLAAQALTEVKSLRLREVPDDGGPWCETEVGGGDIHYSCFSPGETEPGFEYTRIDDDVYLTDERGKITKDSYRKPRDPKMEYEISDYAPFTRSAGDVIAAAAADSSLTELTELGEQEVTGVNTRHFRISVAERTKDSDPIAAIAQLPSAELAWFGLDGIDEAQGVAVEFWVSGDHLIRRVAVSNKPSIEFYDFNAPITIRAPSPN